MNAVHLSLDPLVQTLTHEQFYKLCMANKDVAMERSVTGELIIMPPVGGESGEREADYIIDLGIWNRQQNWVKCSAPQPSLNCQREAIALPMPLGSNSKPGIS